MSSKIQKEKIADHATRVAMDAIAQAHGVITEEVQTLSASVVTKAATTRAETLQEFGRG